MSRRQNIADRPVVLFQLNNLGLREILLKVQDIPDIGTPPLINTLVIVTHNTQIMVTFRQHLNQLVLDMVGVLIFVHHDVLEFSLISK